MSFNPLFEDIDNAGLRMVGLHWRSAGNAVVNNNFARLIPDRQSKKGALWSRKALGVPEFSGVLKFRISGQGKNFFGDGLALWIVQQSFYDPGDLHGFKENFQGVGIIFDTFRNTDKGQVHRDVTVLVNDGEKTLEMMTEDIQGCDAAFRYHGDRADFSVTSNTKAKVTIANEKLMVSIDAKGDDDWVECTTIDMSKDPFRLPKDWLVRAHVGITASTGQLADNHDVISLNSFTDSAVLEAHEKTESEKNAFETAPADMDIKERFVRLETAVSNLLEKLNTLDHHVEHEFVSVDDHINNMIAKLEKREDKSEGRIEILEADVKKQIDEDLENRLNRLELQINGNLNRKVRGMESNLNKQFEESMATTLSNSGAGAWKVPFMIVVVLLIGAAIGLVVFYQKLKKRHIL
jgi:mannose-binding lectin 2